MLDANKIHKVRDNTSLYSMCNGCGMADCIDSRIDVIGLSNALRVKASKIRKYIKYTTDHNFSFDFNKLINFLKNENQSKI